MSDNIHKSSPADIDSIDEDALLAFSHLSGTELDYEFSDILLASDDGKSKVQSKAQSVVSDTSEVFVDTMNSRSTKNVQSLPLSSKEILQPPHATTGAGCKPILQEQIRSNIKSDFHINESDYQSAIPDVLDLQRMADKFAEAGMSKLRNMENSVYEAGGFNYEVVTRVDKLLEEAHDMCYKYQNKLDRATKATLLNMILALKELPHLYKSTRREKCKSARRVTEWLNTHTDQPEPEMCNFTRSDRVQLRKFVSDIQPRMSTSDTNVTLGKRKRGCEDYGDDDVIGVRRSSSDTRVFMHADWSKSCIVGKRRKIRNG